jgi:hypothetical protein
MSSVRPLSAQEIHLAAEQSRLSPRAVSTSKTQELRAERLYLFAEPSRFNTDGKNIELALLIHLPVVSGCVRPAGEERVNNVHGIQTMNTIHRDMESLRWV